MAFNIVDVETGTLVRYRHKLLQFETPDEATTRCKILAEGNGKKYKIKAVIVDDGKWIMREQARMQDGTYVAVPFAAVFWYEVGVGIYTERALAPHAQYAHLIPLIGTIKHHFPHVSMSDKAMLAYTENAEKGAKDIQTQIKPGAYLKKYFGSVLGDDEIKGLVNDWQRRYANAELCFARDPADIVRVYQTGPRSCMSGRADEYQARLKGDYRHPCDVYGQPHSDITMAYIKTKNGIAARCMVWEEKKTYSRIYGDATLLQRELRALGYTQPYGMHFDGAKLAKIPLTRNRYLMPYLDGYTHVLEQDDHFEIRSNRSKAGKGAKWLCCSNTDGVTVLTCTVLTCTECGDPIGADNALSYSGNWYCPDCR